MSLLEKVQTKCAKLVNQTNYRLFSCLSVRDFVPKILIKIVHLTKLLWKKCSIERWFFSYAERLFIEKVHVTVLLFILYSIWVHLESPKYKMICLKSPKSSEFAIRLTNSGKISLTTLILSFLTTINWFLKIEKKNNPATLGFEATKHLRTKTLNENCRKRL